MDSNVINRKNRVIAILLISIVAIIYLFEAIRLKGIFMSGDGNMHYLFSRYAWQHTENLFDLWAKPFYTLLSSPFAYFGVTGIKIFSIVCALLSMYFAYKTAEESKIKNSFLPILFMAFAPIYFLYTNGAYTENLFGLLIISSVYLFLKNKFLLGSIIIAFLPLVRAEGYFILSLYFVFLSLNKKWNSIPFLATGVIIYSIVGYFKFHDILWLIHNNTYNDQMAEVYGKGSFWHFFSLQNDIWGSPFTFFLLIGLIVLLREIVKKKNGLKDLRLWIIIGHVLVYFFIHVILWWKGFNSLGLIRVMSAIIPSSAVIALYGFNSIETLLRKKVLQKSLLAITVILILTINYTQYYYPFRLEAEDEVVLKTKSWFEKNKLTEKSDCVFFLHPFLPIVNNFDPFDLKRNIMIWDLYEIINKYGYDSIPDKTIVIWDAHYGTNEGGVPLQKIMADTNFRMIKTFYPDKPFYVIGNVPFSIRVFEKSNGQFKPELTYQLNYENDSPLNGATRTDSISSDGNFSAKVSPETEFAITNEITGDTLEKLLNSLTTIEVDALSAKQEYVMLVVSFHDKDDRQLSWFSEELIIDGTKKWQHFKFIDDYTGPENNTAVKAKLYFWNKNKSAFFTDNLKLSN